MEILVDMFREAIEVERESYCSLGDPAFQWGTSDQPLDKVLSCRLNIPDWYAGLTNGGATIWDRFIMHLCQCDELGMENDLECEGLSWELLAKINRLLREKAGQENSSFLGFGRRPYRYRGIVSGLEEQHPHGDDLTGGLIMIQSFLAKCQSNPLRFQELLDADDTLAPAQKKIVQTMFNDLLEEGREDELEEERENDLIEDLKENRDSDRHDEDDEGSFGYEPAHSVHLPDEITQMLADLKSIEKSITPEEGFSEQYTELVEILERLVNNGRAMYVISYT
jgi:hypothetical protein